MQTTCDACGGAGAVVEKPCPSCNGQGLVARKVRVQFDVPPGVDSGMSMRLRGEGEPPPAGSGGGERGDLYIAFEVAEHAIFTRDGVDIYIDQPLSFSQLALGVEITVPCLHGEQALQVPPGTQTHKVFRLRGKGMPTGGGDHGDQYVRIVAVTPRKLTDNQKKLFQELAKESKEDLKPFQKKSFFEKVKDTIEDVVG